MQYAYNCTYLYIKIDENTNDKVDIHVMYEGITKDIYNRSTTSASFCALQ